MGIPEFLNSRHGNSGIPTMGIPEFQSWEFQNPKQNTELRVPHPIQNTAWVFRRAQSSSSYTKHSLGVQKSTELLILYKTQPGCSGEHRAPHPIQNTAWVFRRAQSSSSYTKHSLGVQKSTELLILYKTL